MMTAGISISRIFLYSTSRKTWIRIKKLLQAPRKLTTMTPWKGPKTMTRKGEDTNANPMPEILWVEAPTKTAALSPSSAAIWAVSNVLYLHRQLDSISKIILRSASTKRPPNMRQEVFSTQSRTEICFSDQNSLNSKFCANCSNPSLSCFTRRNSYQVPEYPGCTLSTVVAHLRWAKTNLYYCRLLLLRRRL